MEGFILFECALPDAKFRIEVKPYDKEKATEALYKAKSLVESVLWKYGPIEQSKFKTLVENSASKVHKPTDLASALSAKSAGQLEKELAPLITEKIIPADESEAKKAEERNRAITEIAITAYVGALFQRAFPPASVKTEGQPSKDLIRLAANIPGWVAVKKARSNGSAKEVFATLAAIHSSLEKQLVTLCCNTPAEFNKTVDAALSKLPERKSWGRIPEALTTVAAIDFSKFANSHAFSKKVLEQHAFYKALSRVGFPPFASLETIGGAWPEFKVQKPRGRLKKD